jgi:hypothetical protein
MAEIGRKRGSLCTVGEINRPTYSLQPTARLYFWSSKQLSPMSVGLSRPKLVIGEGASYVAGTGWRSITRVCAVIVPSMRGLRDDPEELEDYGRDREKKKRKLVHSAGNQSWHYGKMANDYTNYIEASGESQALSTQQSWTRCESPSESDRNRYRSQDIPLHPIQHSLWDKTETRESPTNPETSPEVYRASQSFRVQALQLWRFKQREPQASFQSLTSSQCC